MLVSEMVTEVALHIHDPSNQEVTAAQLLTFIQSAARDCRSSGWLVFLEDDESLETTANTYEYTIPASFAYIESLWLEETINGVSTYTYMIPRGHYTITYNGSNPVFSFFTLTNLTVGRNIKVRGQQRPTIYTATGNTIDAGMEGFLRERVIYFALRYIGSGQSELARFRQQMAVFAFQSSEAMLKRHPQEFRVKPSSVVVPGRA